MRRAVAVLLWAVACSSWAGGVNRCVDAAGAVRYTNLRCEVGEGFERPRLVLNSWEWHRVKVEKDAKTVPPGQKEDTGTAYNPVPFTGYKGNPVPFSAPDSNVTRSPRYSVVGGK